MKAQILDMTASWSEEMVVSLNSIISEPDGTQKTEKGDQQIHGLAVGMADPDSPDSAKKTDQDRDGDEDEMEGS